MPLIELFDTIHELTPPRYSVGDKSRRVCYRDFILNTWINVLKGFEDSFELPMFFNASMKAGYLAYGQALLDVPEGYEESICAVRSVPGGVQVGLFISKSKLNSVAFNTFPPEWFLPKSGTAWQRLMEESSF